MAFSVNKVFLIGTIGQDPETRFTQNNQSVTNFSLAVSESFKRKDSQEWEERTTWLNIVVWNASDYIKENLKKGKKIYLEGKISIEQYEDKDGVKRNSTKIIAGTVIPFEKGERKAADTPMTDSEAMAYGKEMYGKNENEADLPF